MWASGLIWGLIFHFAKKEDIKIYSTLTSVVSFCGYKNILQFLKCYTNVRGYVRSLPPRNDWVESVKQSTVNRMKILIYLVAYG